MLFRPRVIGGALQRKIECHFDLQLLCSLHKLLEIFEGAKLWIDCVVATGG